MEQQDQSKDVSSTIRRRIWWWWLRLPLAGFVICTVCLALFTELEIWGSLLWGGLAALTACLV